MTEDASPATTVIAPAAAPDRLPAQAPSPTATTTASTPRTTARPSSPDHTTLEWPIRVPFPFRPRNFTETGRSLARPDAGHP